MNTAEIVQSTSEKPLYLWSDDDLAEVFVSSRSRWSDPRWHFDNETPGSRWNTSTVVWNVTLPDGTALTDSKHEVILGWLRRLVWSLHVEPGNGYVRKAASMYSLSLGIRRFAQWMVANGYQCPSELNNIALNAYLLELPELILDGDGDISHGGVWLALMIPLHIWRQRNVLAKAGIKPMPAEPFGGRSAQELADSIVDRACGWIKPLPDEVAIPLLNRSAWFIGVPGEDIIALQSRCLKAYQNNTRIHMKSINGPITSCTRAKRQNAAAKSFKFSILDGHVTPWRPNLQAKKDEEGKHWGIGQQFRQLVIALRNACVIMLQATGGMRISEICGLPAGIDLETGLPACVRIEESSTGLNELFIVRTLLSKTEETPRNVDWVIGMRPKGNTEWPLAVRAIEMLNRLLEPFRSHVKSDRLLVSFKTTRGLPKLSDGIGPILSDRLRESIKDFVCDWVDLSNLPDESACKTEDNDLIPWRESKGRIIKTHQFRKTWARFAIAVDSRLLPVIQMHFHHLSQAMTEAGYVGNNPVQLEPLLSIQRQQTNLFMFELATGKNLVAGRMGTQLQVHTIDLRTRVKGMSTKDAWEETVSFCLENDLRLWFAPHGKCLPLSPASMRCHEIADTSSWLNKQPNYSTRDPSVCAGCSCFVLDNRHKGFWEDRYLQNKVSYKQAERLGTQNQFRVIRERAEQAGKLLREIGIDTSHLDEKIESILLEK